MLDSSSNMFFLAALKFERWIMEYKLLLADDSITIQKVVELIIGDEGFELKITSDGQEALKVIHEYKPDIVLADIEMPKMNGYELCRNIKFDPELQSTPVILLVAAFDVFDEQKAAEVKADRHLPKPFGKDEFLSIIADVLEDKKISESVKEESLEVKRGWDADDEEIKESTVEKDIEAVELEEIEQLEIADHMIDELQFTEEPSSFKDFNDSSVIEAKEDRYSALNLDVSMPPEKMQDAIGKAIENMVERALPDMTSMIMDSIKASIPQKDIITAIFKETIKESIDETKGEANFQFGQKIQEALLSGIPDKEEITVTIKATLAELLKEVVSDEMKEHLTQLMRETLVSLFRDIILSVAWEVIPRVATSIIEEEIKKLTSNTDE